MKSLDHWGNTNLKINYINNWFFIVITIIIIIYLILFIYVLFYLFMYYYNY